MSVLEPSSDQLKPCPFCGGEAFMRRLYTTYIVDAKHDDNCPLSYRVLPYDALWCTRMAAQAAWNRRADHEPSVDGHGECFIAIHMMDGNVQTISDIADTVTIKPDHDDYFFWSDRIKVDCNGWDVTVHFNSDIIQEVKPMHGKAVYE